MAKVRNYALVGYYVIISFFKLPFLLVFLFVPLTACKAEEAITSNSHYFLAVDLNGNGKIDTTPLEQSDVYFDVDGDGLAERTEWVAPEDGFLMVIAKQDNSLKSAQKQLVAFLKNGASKLKDQDQNEDLNFNHLDKINVFETQVLPLNIYIWKDINSNGYPENNELEKNIRDNKKFNISLSAPLQIDRQDKSNIIEEVSFKYEDTNIAWTSLCGSLSYSGASFEKNSDSQFQCLEQGYEPQGMWSKNIWDEYKKGNNHD